MPIIPPDDPGDHGKFVAPIDVNIVGGGSGGDATAANQVTGNNSLASIDSKLVANPLTDAELRATAVPVDGSAVTQPVSATSLPLPAGASTSALQSTGNASLSSVDGKLGTLGQKLMVGSAPVVIASDQSSIPVTTASLPLPTGAATSANQTTANTSLSSIDGKLGTLGQKTMAGSAPVVIASDQSNLPSNLKQINGTTVDSNAGNASAGTQRVVLATDQPTVPVSTAPATSGGNSIYRNLDVNATGQLIKASAGQIYAINVSNVVAQDRFLKFYNKASAPTVGTDTPVMTVVVPKSASGGSVNISVPSGIAFGTGIGVGCTTAVADASVANPGVNDIVLNVLYK